ncbi:MAG: DASH family cryptochrome [Bacteroidota bacterium]|jgi:deoxyribodipyrimidine photo-lyase
MEKTTLIWFRNDLRIHDNPIVFESSKTGNCIGIYIFEDKDVETDKDGLKKLGNFRYNFIIESLFDLQNNLAKINVPLLILKGNTIEILKEKIDEFNATTIFANSFPGTEEKELENKLSEFCNSKQITLKLFSCNTLIHADDLKFSSLNFPQIFTQFRKLVEHDFCVREEIPLPKKINTPAFYNFYKLENRLQKFNLPSTNSQIILKGGETIALKRLEYYLWQTNKIDTYKETRNELLGMDYSTKFSAWLAVGAISPRRIYWEIKKYESQILKNESTYWVIFELLWRDFFQFNMQLFPICYFRFKENKSLFTSEEQKINFVKWKTGNTGVPFVDANMKELLNTGFMSNRGRQNVASFLINDLKLCWQSGAKHFQEYLIDYDVASNYGNWSYLAGKGNDPRTNRYFNIEKQQKTYDPQKLYTNLWNS